MKLFLESADNGNADSQNNLGYMYAYGIGTDIDYSKAKKYLSLAALQGHSQAQVGLGSLTGMAGESPRAIRKHSSYIKGCGT
mgnify:FL=1